MKQNKNIIFASVSAAVLISVLMSILSFGAKSNNIRENVLRMHVIANSDSREDQDLKLRVRDAVLKEGAELFDGSLDAKEARKVLEPHREELTAAAERVIKESGFDYGVEVFIGKAYFPTRTYDNLVTLPAGEYEAVNVIIGEGKGHNWWCVMFPPMCLPAAESDTEIDDVLSNGEKRLVKSNPRFEPRFKIIEFFEKLTQKF